MMGEDQNTAVTSAAAFAGHIVAATVVFVLIGGASLGLSAFESFARHLGVSDLIVMALKGLEYILFGVNAAAYLLYVVTTFSFFVYDTVKRTFHSTKENDRV